MLNRRCPPSLIQPCAEAPGTLITRARDKRKTLLTSVVRKGDVTMLDIVSTRMLGQFGFLSSVFQIMAANQISVDVVATSEVSVSLTLDPAKLWSRQLIPTVRTRGQDRARDAQLEERRRGAPCSH